MVKNVLTRRARVCVHSTMKIPLEVFDLICREIVLATLVSPIDEPSCNSIPLIEGTAYS
jgi:hypothetical protein